MIVIKMLLLCMLMVVIPIMIGRLIGIIGDLHTEFNITSIIFWFLMGNVTMWAVFQLISVPLIISKNSFLSVVLLWCLLVAGILIAGVIYTIKKGIGKISFSKCKLSKKDIFVNVIVLLSALLLVGYQGYMYLKYMHLDEDDSRFVVNAIEAYDKNIMFLSNPATGEYTGSFVGELVKDVSSPWMIYVAMISKLVRIHPSIIAHSFLPVFLIIMVYASYYLLADVIFDKKFRINMLFVCLSALTHIYFTSSVYSQATFTLTRIWQGKSVVAGVMIPFLLYLLMYSYKHMDSTKLYRVLFIASMGMSLLSGVGIFFSGIMIIIYGMYYNLINKKWKNMIWTLVACIPSFIYCMTYVFVK